MKLKIEVRPWPARVPGQHLWIVVPMFRVNPEAERVDLDGENLLSIEGPGCFWCEQPWTSELAAKPCGGPVPLATPEEKP